MTAYRAGGRRSRTPAERNARRTCCCCCRGRRTRRREETAYIDAETARQIRVDTQILVPGKAKVPAKILTSDYREVAGLKLPFTLTQEMGPIKQVITFKEAKANVDVSNDAFQAPEEVQALIDKK